MCKRQDGLYNAGKICTYDGDDGQKYDLANDPGEDHEPRLINDMQGYP